MVWAAILWKSLGALIAFHGHISNTYEAMLQDQLHAMVQTLFPDDIPIFQDESFTK